MIYIVRHGQTDWNVEGKVQGQQNIGLNKKGRQQAKKASKKLKNIDFDLIFSSPLSRAYETATIITNKEIIKDERLAERSYGDLEGKTRHEMNSLINTSSYENIGYNVENLPDFRKRINSFYDEIKSKYPGKNILVVTHAGVSRYSKYYFEGDPIDGPKKEDILKNAQFFKYDN